MHTVAQGVGAALVCLGTLSFIIGLCIKGLGPDAEEEKDWWEL